MKKCEGAGVRLHTGLVQNRHDTVKRHTMHVNTVYTRRTHCSVCLLVVYVTTMVGVNRGFDDLRAYLTVFSVYKYKQDKYSEQLHCCHFHIDNNRIEEKGSISFV